MTSKEMPELQDYSYDLVFDETECGQAVGNWAYYSLLTDFGSSSDILIRVKKFGDSDLNFQKDKSLANELVFRWNTSAAQEPQTVPADEVAQALKREVQAEMEMQLQQAEVGEHDLPATAKYWRRMGTTIGIFKAIDHLAAHYPAMFGKVGG